ncbi:basic leucine zipper transcriptional factor ATF-like 2 [Bombina bombina]|uniref:basic leucine zipper transcriptional factor ATF-like 2 n=1 Tax=Bombina bombina TaxID=8345 RepID=UPI00235A616B|nr:basic leucine zipper transcriptional factor ATF-like 2 [Bombina bombina]
MRAKQKNQCRKKRISDATRGLLHNDDDVTEDLIKLKRKEKSREAAHKSRKKHTERADALHQEFQRLEKDNAALQKEIQSLQQQQLHWSQILKEHEASCLLISTEDILEFLESVNVSCLLEEPMPTAD